MPKTSEKILFLQGNEACVHGAIAAGCRFFAGYPITPSTEIAEGMAAELPKVGGVFIQMEDEIASISAVIGASVGGKKAMTATSGPGFSLMQEGLGYACIAEIPMVLVNVMRGGPSTGLPTKLHQGDIMQARWGTHGDHYLIVLAPESVKETFFLTIEAFNLAEQFRTPVILLLDEVIGHMREKLVIPDLSTLNIENRVKPVVPPEWYKPYELTTNFVTPMAPFGEGYRYHITGLIHDEMGFPTNNEREIVANLDKLRYKIERNAQHFQEYELFHAEDARTLIVGIGSAARAAKEAVKELRSRRRKVGLFRPITVWPFPERQFREVVKDVEQIFVVEMNQGQLIHEIKKHVKNKPVHGIHRYDGDLITPMEIINKIREVKKL